MRGALEEKGKIDLITTAITVPKKLHLPLLILHLQNPPILLQIPKT
jgi:hypothetical protein